MSAMDNFALPIVNHCRTLSFKKNKRLDNFVFNDNSDNVRQSFYNIHVCNG